MAVDEAGYFAHHPLTRPQEVISMKLTAPDSDRRPGSNIMACLVGIACIIIAISIWPLGVKIKVTPDIVNAVACFVFGLVLLFWVASDWTKWIGNETVTMVVVVVTAIIAVFALNH